MFWMFLIAVAAALVFIKLGALSVWVGVLSLTLKAVLIAANSATCASISRKQGAGHDEPGNELA